MSYTWIEIRKWSIVGVLRDDVEPGSEHITFNSVMLAKLVKCHTTWASGWEVLWIESHQIHIPNGVDVLKLCFDCICILFIYTWNIRVILVISNKTRNAATQRSHMTEAGPGLGSWLCWAVYPGMWLQGCHGSRQPLHKHLDTKTQIIDHVYSTFKIMLWVEHQIKYYTAVWYDWSV